MDNDGRYFVVGDADRNRVLAVGLLEAVVAWAQAARDAAYLGGEDGYASGMGGRGDALSDVLKGAGCRWGLPAAPAGGIEEVLRMLKAGQK